MSFLIHVTMEHGIMMLILLIFVRNILTDSSLLLPQIETEEKYLFGEYCLLPNPVHYEK